MNLGKDNLKGLREIEDFKNKIGIYLRFKKGYSCKFSVLGLDSGFIDIKIYDPCECYKSIPVPQFLEFFNIDSSVVSSKKPKSESCEDGSLSEALDDSLLGGGSGG